MIRDGLPGSRILSGEPIVDRAHLEFDPICGGGEVIAPGVHGIKVQPTRAVFHAGGKARLCGEAAHSLEVVQSLFITIQIQLSTTLKEVLKNTSRTIS